MRRRVGVIVLVGVWASICLGNDICPPEWRNSKDDDTTFQMWEFSNGNNPADLEPGWFNQNDTPSADIYNPEGIADWLPTYSGANGVWGLTQVTPLDLYIPNTGNNEPESWKEIRLQVTYLDPYGDGYEIPVAVEPPYKSLTRVSHQQLDNGYYHDTYDIVIEPNPSAETITLKPIQCALYVDEVVVDTRCIPEPATIGLLGLAGLFLIRKRR